MKASKFLKTTLTGVALAIGLQASVTVAAETSNLLSSTYPLEQIESIVEQAGDISLYPKISNRKAWNSVPAPMKAEIMARAEAVGDYRYTGVPASLLIENTRSGNYRPSSDVQNTARRNLVDLVLAEAVENEGRYMEQIVDIIWAIAEESSWPHLSHYYLHKEGDDAKLYLALPDVTDPVLDLWAGTTAQNLAWTYHILSEKFDEITPRINNRIKHEVNRRVLQPALERDDFWWMGFSGGNGGIINNWNPWISSSWLPSTLILADEETKAQAVHKLLRVVDRFIDSYSADGGIDEGPSYWNHAAGSLFDVLTLLYAWSDGEIDVFQNPKIRNMLQYVYKANVHERWAVNFTDANPKMGPDPAMVYHMGERLDDEKMQKFAALFLNEDNPTVAGRAGWGDMYREMYPMFYGTKNLVPENAASPYERDVWFEGIQHLMARSVDGSAEGFFMAAKAGHNNESHNHNDIGNFIVYYNGEPALIDAGNEEYTLQTFGADRYTLWNMQSDYHNVPTVNGQMQAFGNEYRAENVEYHQDDEKVVFSLNMEGAYPKEAEIDSWRRTITLDRVEGVTLLDSYSLNKVKGKTALNLLSLREVNAEQAGRLVLSMPEGDDLSIHYDADQFEIEVETVELTDSLIIKNWDTETIYRIVMTAKNPQKEGSWTVRITG